MSRRLVFVAASVLFVVAVAAAAAAGRGAHAKPTVNLSAGANVTTSDPQLPNLFVPADGDTEPTTSTLMTAAPTTTMPPASTTSTTRARDKTVSSVTSTTAPAVTTTTASSSHTAMVTAVNNYQWPVTITVGDETTNTWTLNPGASAAPWALTTADGVHGDGASVLRVGTQCGSGDGEDYFHGGHEYTVEAIAGLANSCDATSAGPRLLVHDLTTGTTSQI